MRKQDAPTRMASQLTRELYTCGLHARTHASVPFPGLQAAHDHKPALATATARSISHGRITRTYAAWQRSGRGFHRRMELQLVIPARPWGGCGCCWASCAHILRGRNSQPTAFEGTVPARYYRINPNHGLFIFTKSCKAILGRINRICGGLDGLG